jgi:hypothetical protein
MKPTFFYQGIELSGSIVLGPGGDAIVALNPVRTQDGRSGFLQKADFDALMAGTKVFFVHGRVTYNDTAGCDHWTDFCYRLVLGGNLDVQWNAYTEHNDVDKGCRSQPVQAVTLQGPASDELTKQRSWVGIDSIGPVNLISSKRVRIPFVVTNTGNLPAFDVAAFVQNGTGPMPVRASQSLPFDGVAPEPRSTSAIGIHEKRVVTFDVAPFPTEVVEQIKNGMLLWHCYGWMSYKDVNVNAGTRRTDFCFVYRPKDDGFDYCAGHNTLQ